jgi:hypothetical protein
MRASSAQTIAAAMQKQMSTHQPKLAMSRAAGFAPRM